MKMMAEPFHELIGADLPESEQARRAIFLLSIAARISNSKCSIGCVCPVRHLGELPAKRKVAFEQDRFFCRCGGPLDAPASSSRAGGPALVGPWSHLRSSHSIVETIRDSGYGASRCFTVCPAVNAACTRPRRTCFPDGMLPIYNAGVKISVPNWWTVPQARGWNWQVGRLRYSWPMEDCRACSPRSAVGEAPKRRRKQRLKYGTSLNPDASAISLIRSPL